MAPRAQGFAELAVWQRSVKLCEDIYQAVGTTRDSGFRDQITRAALSVPSNISEGYERGSRADYLRFLYIAKGSLAELRTQLHIGPRIGVLDQDGTAPLLDEAEQISRMLQSMISRLKKGSAGSRN